MQRSFRMAWLQKAWTDLYTRALCCDGLLARRDKRNYSLEHYALLWIPEWNRILERWITLLLRLPFQRSVQSYNSPEWEATKPSRLRSQSRWYHETSWQNLSLEEGGSRQVAIHQSIHVAEGSHRPDGKLQRKVQRIHHFPWTARVGKNEDQTTS